MNIQKSVAFLHINNEMSERECKKAIPFKITEKKKLRNKLDQGGERLKCCEL